MKIESDFEFQIKLVIIGDSGVGKTNFIFQFTEGRFSNIHVTTVGFDYKSKIIKLPNSKKNVKLERFHTMIAQPSNNLKKNVHKYKCSVLDNEKIKNGKSKVDEEDQEIISVEQTYLPVKAKQSSKVINNFKSIELLKSPLLQNKVEQPKINPKALKNPNSNQNYLRLLSDFGERRQSLFKSSGELSRAGSKIDRKSVV